MSINKNIPLIGAVLLAAITLQTSLSAAAPSSAPEKAVVTPSPRPYPFRGTISRVDVSARTVTLASRTTPRVLRLEESSILEKDGKAATLGDIQAGDYLRGQIRKNTERQETIVKAVAGPRPSKEEARGETGSPTPRS